MKIDAIVVIALASLVADLILQFTRTKAPD
jgi:hypothetical protein